MTQPAQGWLRVSEGGVFAKKPLGKMRNYLTISSCILLTVLLLAIGGYLHGLHNEADVIKDLSLNIGTEILGILLTVFLIDDVIRRREERERNRVKKVGFEQLHIPLSHHLHVLHGMYKACVLKPPELIPANLRELFNEEYFAGLKFLDFSRPAPVRSGRSLQWFDYLQMEAETFKVVLERTIERYAIVLKSDSFDLMERLVNSSFLAFLLQAPVLRCVEKDPAKFSPENSNLIIPLVRAESESPLQTMRCRDKQHVLLANEGMIDLVRSYIADLLELVDTYNDVVSQERKLTAAKSFWREDAAPEFGSARANNL